MLITCYLLTLVIEMINKIFKIITILLIILFLVIIGINTYIIVSTKSKIYEIDKIKELSDIDIILVLGASAKNGKPSPMLEDRILKGVELYNRNVSEKLIMSGDHIGDNYDEVGVMKNYAINLKVPSEDIFMDHAGISTYDSIYRAKEIFGVKRMVIVTQKYHLYRALYIARSLGIEAYGVNSEGNNYRGQFIRELREIAGRNKDFIKVLLKPKSKYLGQTITVSGDGNITNDRSFIYDR